MASSATLSILRGTQFVCCKIGLQARWVNSTKRHSHLLRQFHATSTVCYPAHDAEFENAKNRLNALKEDPGNETKLKIYGLFKQATQGKCNAPKPGMMDLVGKAKWSAWNSLGDMSQDEAQLAYISLVDSLAGQEEAELADQKANQGPGEQYEGMTITRENKIFHIRLNRPKKKNAITWQATFHTPFSALGQSPEACSSYIFPKVMGYAKANEMLLFNRKITAAEAKDRGLVSEVIPDQTFQAESSRLIEQYASFPPQSMRYSKVLNRSSELATLKAVNKAECELLEERWQSQECIKAIMAFFSRK
ncbi:enoyl-coa delta isomerase 2, mitochondrial [Plakobranchus ocellatus]|uniref:Enoyl-coa delta isomerase 2, mitochondrial n=1 Tax=Plakobranchus ocellatus TaxID=259542 RepID=A0AAV3YWG9_9GAST|nr:enoyl-coa delta isomerase 2, mitochondrial [Plakobranchus ocellatus]